MIEFDESENLKSNFTDTTLQFILDMYGGEVKDKLLIPRVAAEDVDRGTP